MNKDCCIDKRNTNAYNLRYENTTDDNSAHRGSKAVTQGFSGIQRDKRGSSNRNADTGRGEASKIEVIPHIFEQGQVMKAPAQA